MVCTLTVSVYNELVPAFSAILQESENALALFYRTCQHLANQSKEERRMILEKYLKISKA
jgi:predicted aminopeptidase